MVVSTTFAKQVECIILAKLQHDEFSFPALNVLLYLFLCELLKWFYTFRNNLIYLLFNQHKFVNYISCDSLTNYLLIAFFIYSKWILCCTGEDTQIKLALKPHVWPACVDFWNWEKHSRTAGSCRYQSCAKRSYVIKTHVWP